MTHALANHYHLHLKIDFTRSWKTSYRTHSLYKKRKTYRTWFSTHLRIWSRLWRKAANEKNISQIYWWKMHPFPIGANHPPKTGFYPCIYPSGAWGLWGGRGLVCTNQAISVNSLHESTLVATFFTNAAAENSVKNRKTIQLQVENTTPESLRTEPTGGLAFMISDGSLDRCHGSCSSGYRSVTCLLRW